MRAKTANIAPVSSTAHTVAVVVFDGVASSGSPSRGRSSAPYPHGSGGVVPVADLRVGLVRLSNGVRMEVTDGLARLSCAEHRGGAALQTADGPSEAVLQALRRAHARGARLVSLCTGAFVLAAAGLLDGRRVTTHWAECAELAARYPSLTVEPDVLYVDDGDILTSAGSAAAIDLCLHLVRGDHGAEAATRVARDWSSRRTATAARPSSSTRRCPR